MSGLLRIEKGRKYNPPRVIIHGSEGIGKTTFGASAPSPIFIQTEDGVDEIGADRFPLSKNLKDVWESLKVLSEEKHEYKTVVLDSLDWTEQLIWQHICESDRVATIEQARGGYGKGYIAAARLFKDLLERLQKLRDNRGMTIIMTAHSKVEKFEDPEHAPYDRYSPRLHKHSNALVCEWADAILFATRKMRVNKEDGGFGRSRGTATGLGKTVGGDRIMRVTGSPSAVAKNRYGLQHDLPLEWSSFVDAVIDSASNGTIKGDDAGVPDVVTDHVESSDVLVDSFVVS
jgi:hypothetical protein